jgi:hypothetical protein
VTNRNSAVDTVIELLAVYRATRLLQRDDLPPLPALREKLMDRYGTSPWSALLDCPWCLSIWLGFGSQLIRRALPRIWRIGASALASSAMAGLISEWLDNLELPETATEAAETLERAAESMTRATNELDRLKID